MIDDSHALTNGRFGDAECILDDAGPSLESLGVPPRLSRSFGIHPLLDNAVFHARDRPSSSLSVLSSNLLHGVTGDPQGSERWFQRDHPLDLELRRRIHHLLNDDDETSGSLRDPNERDMELISAADTLLKRVIPELWSSTRPFATRVYIADAPGLSGVSWDDLQGVIVLGPECRDEVSTAESLLHEAVHSKSYRLFRSFQSFSGCTEPEFIPIPWWETDESTRQWDVDRATVACHVYGHLALFNGELGRSQSLQRTSFRTHYLANVLLQLPARLLDPERREFVRWIASSVPPVKGLNANGQRILEQDVSHLIPSTAGKH